MSYSIELKNICLKDYKEILRNQNILPGRRILQDNIDENFASICRCGIDNVEELHLRMKTPQKLESLALISGLSTEFLTILKREIGSFIQKPVSIADFPDLSSEVFTKLSKHGITTSKEVYESTNGFTDYELVCNELGISEKETKELLALCDLVRINGVGAVFARILYIAGLNSVRQLADADAEDILKKVSEVNEKKQYTKAKLGKKDMQFCIDFAKLIVRV